MSDGRRVRLLINAVHAKSGGGVTYLRNILPHIAADRELEIHAFLDADQFALFHPIDERVRVHVFRFKPGLVRLLLWEQFFLPWFARMMHADVIFSPANYGPLLFRNTVILLRNSLAVVGRESRLIKRIYWVGLALMTFLSLVTCRRAIAVSQYAAQVLTFGLGRYVRQRTTVIYHGVTPYDPTPSPPVLRLGPDDEGAFLLVVGDIYVQKNLHNLLESFLALRARFPHLLLKIAGRKIDEEYYAELRCWITDRGLDDAVEFLGHLPPPRIEQLYRRCAAFVFPSTIETFGNPLIEAVACGAPVACSQSSAMPEIAGDAVEYFDPLDCVSMAEVIARVLLDSERRAALAEAGRRRAAMFSWPVTARKTADVIKSCMGALHGK